VYLAADGSRPADSQDPANADSVLGLTVYAQATPGLDALIQTAGEMTDPAWSWAPNEPVFLGSGETPLTQTPPATGAIVELGPALTATSLLIRIQRAIFRA
ncbi:MAG: hypothetical protein ACREUF_03040, partial [Solimonas sp.]